MALVGQTCKKQTNKKTEGKHYVEACFYMCVWIYKTAYTELK